MGSQADARSIGALTRPDTMCPWISCRSLHSAFPLAALPPETALITLSGVVTEGEVHEYQGGCDALTLTAAHDRAP